MACSLRTLPAYYPTTTIVVDDDPLFLKGLSRALLPDNPVRLFIDPLKAIEYIRQPNPVETFSMHWGKTVSDDSSVNISLGAIQEQMHIDGRYSEISCIVADYSMPQMNGLKMITSMGRMDLCRVLFTGNATLEMAIGAFNNQLI